jgi:protoheme IX farnesyltransferase
MTTTTARGDTLRDFSTLIKPSITLQVMITTAGGLWMAPGDLGWLALVAALIGTVFIVASANTLNCYLERDSDRFMARTANRPLPAGRMDPKTALRFGTVLALLAIPMLTFVNPVTGLLAALALVSYVWVYTPMKQLSPHAVIVGAIPGAMPPLMGWTAVTGRVEWPGVVLFGILFLWQMPHFIAISVYRQEEYDRAGIYTVPSVFGVRAARWHMIFWTALLVPTSLLLVPLGVAGWIYATIAGALGLGFAWWVLKGLRTKDTVKWARSFFLYTLVYLTVLFAAILVDAGPW